jgi:hypothetical protein
VNFPNRPSTTDQVTVLLNDFECPGRREGCARGVGSRFHDETVEEAYASRQSFGAPDWEVEGWVTSYAAIAAGDLESISDTVERLAGHQPMTLAEYIRAQDIRPAAD